jgi:NodT family efflux transporter outer membrane factor (OMF) lipoprotein
MTRPKRPAAAIGTAVIVTALALGGCDLGPDFMRPETETPGEWREGDLAENAAWPSADWWREFGSAELNEMMKSAQQANADLGAAIARVKQADAQVRIAGAPLLPSVNANAGPSTQQVVFPTNGGQQIPYSAYTVGLSASYEVDFWGKNAAVLAAAKAAAHASRYDQQVVALTVVSSVATTYFQALGLQDRLHVARDNLANAENVLKLVRDQARVGTAMDLNVAQQETVVAGLRATIPPLQQQYSQTLDALAILLNRPPNTMRLAAQSLVPLPVPMVAPGLPSELLERRPDVREAEAQLVAANANIKVARASFFPSLSLTAAGGFESLALSSFLSPASTIYSLAASLMQPIFEGGKLRGQLAYSKARYEELLQNYRKAVISAFSNVEDALAATRRTAEQQESQQVAVAKARRAYEIAQLQYGVGSTDLLTVLNTENALFSANDLLAQVRIARMQALVSLFNALGGGWQDGGSPTVATAATLPAGNGRR